MMIRFSQLTTHWTPEDAHTILTLLDELRDTLWATYGNDIIEYCHQHLEKDNDTFADIDDDKIPF